MNWIFEGIVDWVAVTTTELMDAVSGIFLNALGTDMLAMESYFPFVSTAFTVIQYIAWTILFLITIWQLFRSFGGPITEAENPWSLILRSALFAVLIWFAKPIFLYVLEIAKAPYGRQEWRIRCVGRWCGLSLPVPCKRKTFKGLECNRTDSWH